MCATKLFYDLHLHSCLSPCGSEENTPADLAAMCALAGLNVVALTDHNTAGNCAAFLSAAARHGLLALPGMELTTAEEVHVVCLFPTLDAALAFDRLVGTHLPAVNNNPSIFGPQILMDDGDGVLGEEPRMLAAATDLPVGQVYPLVRSFGGVAYPAHIDRPSFSLLSNLGLWDPSLGFPLAELSLRCPPDFAASRPDLRGVRTITSSDAHYLHQIPDAQRTLEVDRPTPESVIDCLTFSLPRLTIG